MTWLRRYTADGQLDRRFLANAITDQAVHGFEWMRPVRVLRVVVADAKGGARVAKETPAPPAARGLQAFVGEHRLALYSADAAGARLRVVDF